MKLNSCLVEKKMDNKEIAWRQFTLSTSSQRFRIWNRYWRY